MNINELKSYVQQLSPYEIKLEIIDKIYNDGFVMYNYKKVKVVDSDGLLVCSTEIREGEVSIVGHSSKIVTRANKDKMLALINLIGQRVEFE